MWNKAEAVESSKEFAGPQIGMGPWPKSGPGHGPGRDQARFGPGAGQEGSVPAFKLRRHFRKMAEHTTKKNCRVGKMRRRSIQGNFVFWFDVGHSK